MGGTSFVSALYRAMKDGEDREVARLIGGHGADLANGMDGCIASPLIAAVFSERADYLQALLDAGAPVDQRDTGTHGSSYNLRALEAALWFDEPDMVARLLAAGASEDFGTLVFRQDVPGVRQAIERDETLLESAYIRFDYTLLHVSAHIGSAPLTELFLGFGLDPCALEGSGHSPLYYAARNVPAIEVCELLVNAGADINHASKTGITALTAAVRHEDSLPTVRWLLAHGADPNQIPKNGTSPLMKAAGNRSYAMADLLLDHGADPAHRNKKDESALDIAHRRKALDIVKRLGG